MAVRLPRPGVGVMRWDDMAGVCRADTGVWRADAAAELARETESSPASAGWAIRLDMLGSRDTLAATGGMDMEKAVAKAAAAADDATGAARNDKRDGGPDDGCECETGSVDAAAARASRPTRLSRSPAREELARSTFPWRRRV